MRQVDVLRTPVTTAPIDEVCEELERRIALRRPGYVCFANVHVVETARRSRELARCLGEAAIVLPDGAPVAWLAERRAGTAVARIAGLDLFEELCRRSLAAGYRHFFYGSTPETLACLTKSVAQRYPGIRICGSLAPPHSPTVELHKELIAAVNSARPDIVWVGLGAPKQELWIRLARPLLEAPLLLGVGAVFDLAGGRKSRAPRLLQRLWLEWAFRLAQEPRRLSGRYLATNTSFLLRLACSLLRPGGIR